MKRKKQNNSGFTFIEVILYVAIIGMVLVSVISFSFSVQEPREKIYGNQETDANALFAMNEITKLVRLAESINISGSVFDSSPGLLSLEMADPAKNPTIISVSLDDALQITQGIDSPIRLTSNQVRVDSLIFTRLDNLNNRQNIKIDLAIETTAPEASASFGKTVLQTSVTTRK